ncbi:hypothetical protein Bhyg_04976, partial [Pseudolycoriella hygida]
MNASNIFLLIVAVIFIVKPAISCNVNACRKTCISAGANDGICQLERNGQFKCICSYNPTCVEETCRNDCLANGVATGGICQVDRTGLRYCICSYN